MPRIVVAPKPGRQSHADHVQALAKELRHPSSKSMPYILEETIADAPLRSVTVIWDRWSRVRDEDRSDVILAAYEAAEGADFATTIAAPTGLTPAEALALGYLPYRVEATDAGPFGKAFVEEAGRSLFPKATRTLRYARREEAEAARDRLQKALPNSHWTLVEERAPA